MAHPVPAKIAILSDIHGNLPALEAVMAVLRDRSPDLVVNLGDSVSGPLFPRETAALLMQQDWLHLAGNHERQLLAAAPGAMTASDQFARSQLTEAQLGWLGQLEPAIALSESIFFCHGTPHSDHAYLLETVESGQTRLASADEIRTRLGHVQHKLVGCGHSHVPRSVRTGAGQWLINPGSVGLPAYSDDAPAHHKVEQGSPDARFAWLHRTGEGGWHVSLECVPYDHLAASRQAMAQQRPDWAHALLTGYVLDNANHS